MLNQNTTVAHLTTQMNSSHMKSHFDGEGEPVGNQQMSEQDFLAFYIMNFLTHDEMLFDAKETEEIFRAIDQKYNVPDDEKLDQQNMILQYTNAASDVRRNANTQNLFTVDACSVQINKILIGQHEDWI